MGTEVSVIIPTYKNPYTISRAIDSVLTQKDFDSYEIIVVDDNNPDSDERKLTEKELDKYKGNAKVKYIKHPQNMNGAAARNTGFYNSKGRYIAFLDDDDIFIETKLRKQYDYMQMHPEFGASYTWRIQSRNEIVKYSKTGNLTKEILLLDFFPTTITIMMRKECFQELNGFDVTFRRHQDFEFLIRYFEKFNIGVVPEPLSRIIGKKTVGNQLRGKNYEDLKKQFLQTFDQVITKLDQSTPGIKKEIYAAHCADVFVSEVSSHYYPMAIRTMAKGMIKYRLYFLKRVVKHYKQALNRRR